MPHYEARGFATWFYQLKAELLSADLRRCGKHPATWEKKGCDFFTSRNVRKYAHIREAANRLINKIYKLDGRIIYYGREKYMTPDHSNPSGLYTTVLSHTIRSADKFCQNKRQLFTMTLDQHSDRIRLLETSAKTMFGSDPARNLIEPPFHVESHLYQTVQAADWIATLVGRLLAYRASPIEFQDWDWAENYFGSRIDGASTHSRLWRPSSAKRSLTAEPYNQETAEDEGVTP
jgi:hypothetical protein